MSVGPPPVCFIARQLSLGTMLSDNLGRNLTRQVTNPQNRRTPQVLACSVSLRPCQGQASGHCWSPGDQAEIVDLLFFTLFLFSLIPLSLCAVVEGR